MSTLPEIEAQAKAQALLLEGLVAKQNALAEEMAALATETDAERLQQRVGRLIVSAQALEAEARVIATRVEAEAKVMSGAIEVVLTAPQRERIRAETGIDMETIVLRDETGTLSQLMPGTDARVIEATALAEARRRKAHAEVEERTRAELESQLMLLAGLSPAHAELVEQRRRDPDFLGGILGRT